MTRSDPDATSSLRRLLRAVGKSDLASLEPERLLEDLRLAESGRLRRAGVLLVGTEAQITRSVPTHGYAFQHRPTPGQEALFRVRECRPIVAAVESLMSAVVARSTVVPLNLSGGAQLTLEQLPAAAVRELLVNEFVYRNYETNGSVEVEYSPESLSISSPGGLIAGVTPDNILTHPSTPRNRLLMETVAMLGMAERTGHGIDRVYRELLRVGKPPVQFHDSGTLVRASIAGAQGDRAFARYLASLNESWQNDIEVLLVVRALCVRATVSASKLAIAIQRDASDAERLLARLADAEPPLLTRTKKRSYRLAADHVIALGRAITYRTTDAGEFDAKVVGHLEEFGVITNRPLQRMFDVSVFGARDLLRELQNRGVLVKLSLAKQGPGVQYGPGPNVPKSTPKRSRRAAADESPRADDVETKR